jgi:prophage regulatory protein
MSANPKSCRAEQIAEMLGIGKATLWRWSKERADFPKGIRLSARCTVWDRDEVLAWRNAQGQKAAA